MNEFLPITYKGDVTANRLGSYANHVVIYGLCLVGSSSEYPLRIQSANANDLRLLGHDRHNHVSTVLIRAYAPHYG